MKSLEQLLNRMPANDVFAGEPTSIAEFARCLKKASDTLDAAQADFDKLPVGWEGNTAVATRARAAALQATWSTIRQRMNHAAVEVERYGSSLTRARQKYELTQASFDHALEAAARELDPVGWSLLLGSRDGRASCARSEYGGAARDIATGLNTTKDEHLEFAHKAADALKEAYPTGHGHSRDSRGYNDDEPSLADLDGVGLTDEDLQLKNVRQGAIGDCWLLAALGAIAAKDPDFIRRHLTRNADGSYTVRIYGGGFRLFGRDLSNYGIGDPEPIDIRVEGPATRGDGVTDGAGNQNWLSIYEAAVEQYRKQAPLGSITAGTPEEGLSLVTGQRTRGLIPAVTSLNDIRDRLAAGEVMTGLTGPPIPTPWNDSLLIVPFHVYTVESVVDRGGQTYIRMHNPWGDAAAGPEAGIVELTEKEFRANFAQLGTVKTS